MKRVVLCADDFGMDPAVDAGILQLLGMGRLTAVSCLAEAPAFEADLEALLAFREAADLGLHLDLTGGSRGGSHWRLPALLLRAYLGAIDGAEVGRRVEAQLGRFERLAGRPPDFIDGHQHVHQFPRVRDALVGVLRRRYGPEAPLCPLQRSQPSLGRQAPGCRGAWRQGSSRRPRSSRNTP